MKVRNGFVSNSSSTCFLLDLRNPKVEKLLKHVVAGRLRGLCRNTAKAIGRDAMDFAAQLEKDEFSAMSTHMIRKAAEEIGEENVVLLRESDECMGGLLFNRDDDGSSAFGYRYDENKDDPTSDLYKLLDELSISEWEYH